MILAHTPAEAQLSWQGLLYSMYKQFVMTDLLVHMTAITGRWPLLTHQQKPS